MFRELQKITFKPAPYAFYTADRLWTDPYISSRMLEFHLSKDTVLASRKPDFIKKSVQWLIQNFDIRKGLELADFGCGPGLYTVPLASTEASVTGIDFSLNSIQYARKIASGKNLDLEYLNVDYLDFESDRRFDLIIMIYCDYSALSPEQRKSLLNIFHRHLKDRGKVILDVHSRQFFDSAQEEMSFDFIERNGFWSSDPHYVFSIIHKYLDEHLYLNSYTIYEKDRTSKIYNWLQSFTQDELEAEFHSNGFDIVEFFSNVAGDPFTSESHEIALVAQKN